MLPGGGGGGTPARRALAAPAVAVAVCLAALAPSAATAREVTLANGGTATLNGGGTCFLLLRSDSRGSMWGMPETQRALAHRWQCRGIIQYTSQGTYMPRPASLLVGPAGFEPATQGL